MSIPCFTRSGERLGCRSKREVHQNGDWHRSVLMWIIRQGEVLEITRGTHQSYASRSDVPGGHEDEGDEGDLLTTCLREASEELEITVEGKPFKLDASQFRLVGVAGAMIVDLPNNREWSSLYCAYLPESAEVLVTDFDDDEKEEIPLESTFRSLDSLLERYAQNPDFAADGLGRILKMIREDAAFRHDVETCLKRQFWTICFGDSRPGEPGSGGPDNDFYAEHRFFGIRSEAKAVAREISREQYRGDFVWWLMQEVK